MLNEPREEEILVNSEGSAGVSQDGQISSGGIIHDGLVERRESVLAPQRLGEQHHPGETGARVVELQLHLQGHLLPGLRLATGVVEEHSPGNCSGRRIAVSGAEHQP